MKITPTPLSLSLHNHNREIENSKIGNETSEAERAESESKRIEEKRGGETKGKAEITNVGNKSCHGSGGETRAQSAHWKTASRGEKNRQATSGRLGRELL